MAKSLQDSSIILVGNSVELLKYNYGDYIDSFDYVVRFGQGVPEDYNYSAVGRRTDFWVTGWLRKNFWHRFPNAKILFNRSRIHMNVEPNIELPFDNHTIMFNDKELLKIFEQIGATNDNAREGARPSAGFVAILYFLKKLKCKNITLIGFDFFSKKLPIKSGGDHPASWHLPFNSSVKNPHNPHEKGLVWKWYNEGKLDWKILSNLDSEFLDLS